MATSFVKNITAGNNAQVQILDKVITNTATDGDGATGFPYLRDSDLRVSIKSGGGSYTIKDISTHWTVNNDTKIQFNAGVLSNGTTYTVKVERVTKVDVPAITFNAGSAIKAADLNKVFKQFMYSVGEFPNNFGNFTVFPTGDRGAFTVTGDGDTLSTIQFNLKNDAVTTAKILDDNVTYAKLQDIGTANRVLGKASTGTVEEVQIVEAMIAADAVNGTKIADDSINSEHYVDGSIDTAHIADSQITLAKLASALVTSIQTTYSNPVGTVIWFAGSAPPKGYLKANGATITDSTTAISGNDSDGDAIGTVNTAALFAITGATLPDLRGEFIRGFDDGKGTDSGRGIRTSQTDEWKKHQHIFHGDDTSRAHWGSDGDGASDSFIRVSDDNMDFVSTTTGGGGGKYLTQSNSQGNSGGTETRPRNIALLACIKY